MHEVGNTLDHNGNKAHVTYGKNTCIWQAFPSRVLNSTATSAIGIQCLAKAIAAMLVTGPVLFDAKQHLGTYFLVIFMYFQHFSNPNAYLYTNIAVILHHPNTVIKVNDILL